MNYIYYFLWVLLAVVLQVLLFNRLSLAGGIVIVYMIALLKMPVEVPRIVQILIGFLVGLMVDIFCNTLGMHALATVTVMFFREPLLHLFYNDPEFKNGSVGMERIGMASYIRYALTILAFHSILLYFIEAFTLFNFLVLLSKIFISIALSLLVAIVFEFSAMKK